MDGNQMINQQEFITGVATSLAEDAVKYGWEKIKNFFVGLNEKDAIDYKMAYEKYLYNTKKRNGKIKTIIYRHVPKDIYSFYVSTDVKYEGKRFDTKDINSLLSIGNNIIFTGTGGIGKSILFKHLFLNTIENTSYIPVLIELRSFNVGDIKNISLYEALYNSLCENGFSLRKEAFEYSLVAGGYIFFFDGFDEINRDRISTVSAQLKTIVQKYDNNKFFVSSRPMELFIGWNSFCEVQALKLSKKQALELIDKIEFDESAKRVFYDELNDRLYKKYESFASNPLLLNIMLLTFQKHASIPDRLNDFYDEAFVTLFNAHDATKEAFVRDIRCGLGCEDFKNVFSYICFLSYFKEEYHFSETRIREYIKKAIDKYGRLHFTVDEFQDDLTMSVCMLVKDGLDYRFAHRSFQEYFAAWYTCKLSDDVQSKLISSWIKESKLVLSDSYITMLYDLQSEKVNKLILRPILVEIQKLYKTQGYSTGFLRKLFDNIKVNITKDDKGVHYIMSFAIANQYLCYGLLLNARLNGYIRSSIEDEENTTPIYEKLIKDTINLEESGSYHHTLSFTFEEALEKIDEKELLYISEWLHQEVLFAFEIIKENEDINLRKKKVSSIIDQL